MGKRAKLAKLRQDTFYKLAKETGYRSRASFKLIQLNRKYGFLNDARVLVDLCAAPGGWLQVAANVLPVSSVIIGVDLVPIKPIRNVITQIGDITTDSCVKNIKRELQDWKVDIVLHDGAPNLGQNWLVDAFGQAQLTLSAIKLMTQILVAKGWFITKVFRSKDYINIINLLSKLFNKVHSTKPIASRKESAEIFVVCQGFIGCKNFDQKIINFKNVFKDNDVTKAKVTLKKLASHKKPNKGGYDDNASPYVYESRNLSDFLNEQSPLEFLSSTTQINIDKHYFQPDNITPVEIKECLKDVKVLGLREIKLLLSWRKKLIKKFNLSIKTKEELDTDINQKNEDDIEKEDIEEAIRAEKLESKSETKKKNKMQKRISQKLTKTINQINDTGNPMEDEDNMFSIASLNDITGLQQIVYSKKEIPSIYQEENEPTNIHKRHKQGFTLQDEAKLEYGSKLNKLKKGILGKTASGMSSLLTSHSIIQDNELTTSDSSVNEDEEADVNFLLGMKPKKSSIKHVHADTITEKPQVKQTVLSPEELAVGAFIKKSSKNKKQLLEDSWNRNVKAGEENLPSWFEEYENTHRIIQLPITKEDVEFYRKKRNQLLARPIKKEIEAKMRKKQRKIALLEKTQTRVDKLLDGENDADKDKVNQVKNIYKKANKLTKKKQKKTYIVAKKSLSTGRRYKRPASVKGPVKVVDPRMKKDSRNMQFNKKGKRSKSRMRNRR